MINKHKLKQNLDEIFNKIKQKDIRLHAYLKEGKPQRIEGNKLIVWFPKNKEFHRDKLKENKEKVNKVFENVLE